MRLFLAANRIGKTEAACYENSLHLTGLYPKWWEGKVFDTPTQGWAAGESAKVTRDTLQTVMFGDKEELGTGLIPATAIIRTTAKHGLADAFDTVRIRHVSGGVSKLIFKSFEEGVEKFRSTAQHFIHLDEEPPIEIKAECVTRTMTTDGVLLITLTPLKGRTQLLEEMIESASNQEDLADLFSTTQDEQEVEQ